MLLMGFKPYTFSTIIMKYKKFNLMVLINLIRWSNGYNALYRSTNQLPNSYMLTLMYYRFILILLVVKDWFKLILLLFAIIYYMCWPQLAFRTKSLEGISS